RTAHASVNVHIRKDTVLAVHSVHRNEDRVVLRIGDLPSEVSLFLAAAELERLHDIVHQALIELGHATIGNSPHEAYAAGWDAALSFVQTNTGQPVPTTTPVVPIGVG